MSSVGYAADRALVGRTLLLCREKQQAHVYIFTSEGEQQTPFLASQSSDAALGRGGAPNSEVRGAWQEGSPAELLCLLRRWRGPVPRYLDYHEVTRDGVASDVDGGVVEQ